MGRHLHTDLVQRTVVLLFSLYQRSYPGLDSFEKTPPIPIGLDFTQESILRGLRKNPNGRDAIPPSDRLQSAFFNQLTRLVYLFAESNRASGQYAHTALPQVPEARKCPATTWCARTRGRSIFQDPAGNGRMVWYSTLEGPHN